VVSRVREAARQEPHLPEESYVIAFQSPSDHDVEMTFVISKHHLLKTSQEAT
jgi:hypothetical protein